MGDDTVIVVPTEPETEPVIVDNTRDEILIQFGELSAKVAQLEALYARIDGLELSIRSAEERISGQELALAGYAPIEHNHPEYALREEIIEPEPEPEPPKPDKEPERQNFWFRRVGQ